MELDKLKKIIADVLNVDENEITQSDNYLRQILQTNIL